MAIAHDYAWALRVEQRVTRAMREARRLRTSCGPPAAGESSPADTGAGKGDVGVDAAAAAPPAEEPQLQPPLAALVSDFRRQLDDESRQAGLALLRVASLRAAYATVRARLSRPAGGQRGAAATPDPVAP